MSRHKANARLIGVSTLVREDQVASLSDADQDVLIAQVRAHLTPLLAEHVGHAAPLSDVVFSVTGPHQDPLQGLVHVHTLAAQFDADALPLGCAARVHLEQGGPAPSTEADPLPVTEG